MQIDCYGFEASSQWFKRRTLDPYLIKRSEGITYLCFGNQLNRPVALGLAATLKSFGDFRRISLAGRCVAAVLPSVEGTLRNCFGITKLVLRRISESTETRTDAFASRGRSDVGLTRNPSATSPSKNFVS